MKSLQEVLQNQLKETSERAEKQQATINFLKTDMERKSKMIRDLQNENKSLKNKLLSGSKLCGIHAEESKKIQAQLKELRYGKKDLLFKLSPAHHENCEFSLMLTDPCFSAFCSLYVAQQLTELERKLAVAKNELEKAALDRDSQLKAMKETVHLCLSTVFRNQPPPLSLTRSNPTQMPVPPGSVGPLISDASRMQPPQTFPGRNESFQIETTREENPSTTECNSQKLLQEGRTCLMKPKDNQSSSVTIEPVTTPKKLQMPPCTECEVKKTPEKQLTSFDGRATREEKIL
eukprot:XP_022263650.1 leucine zipper protein 2 isoform X1 [Canis lupus familiaris]